MSRQICALRLAFPFNRTPHSLHIGRRSFVSRSALKDEGTKKVIQDIRKLEQKLETSRKMEQASFAKLTERDIEAIYNDLATTSNTQQQTQPKINADYLENLRVKFLDTRPLRQLRASSTEEFTQYQNDVPSHSIASTIESNQERTQPNLALISTEDEQAKTSLSDVTIHDFEQLIYVNALARRPEQAEQALQLMKNYDHMPTVRCYNHLMDAYANVDNVEQVVAVFKRLGENDLSPDVYSYSSLIKVLVQASRLDDAFIVFDRMKAADTTPTQPIFANLINGCLKSRLMGKAWKTFDEMRLSYYQPDEVTFTMMLHACAKNGEVERALNLFEDMSGLQLYPTDVTFNVLIHACAKRPDYYDEAFSLLHQMEDIHGFRPDLITYNTLLGACARKKDLGRARDIFRHLLQADDMNPDYRSFTNLFWCYANYDPPSSSIPKSSSSSSSSSSSPTSSSSSSSPTSSSSSSPTSSLSSSPTLSSSSLVSSTANLLIPHNLPARRSAVVSEATTIFNFMVQQQQSSPIEMTPALLTAYLNMHVMQQQTQDCVSIYDTLFSTHDASPNANTFKVMLRHCYQTKNSGLAWRIWDDYKAFLEQRALPVGLNELSIIEQKKITLKHQQQQFHEGWTLDQQRSMVLLMASVLARANELHYAIQLLNASFTKGGDMKALRLKEVQTILNKAVQLEDEEMVHQVKQLCSWGPKKSIPGSTKYRRVNSVM
ncbi:hypothetical protein BCR42DRAFT_488925 [Absidia repens]|uniref:Pentacotripeptide-repeat region of PRORP domain-containing protein n=1 Tax=Absidia repens TaxID=90262 RepID=A0A1X2IRP9_9FUNG|nr:hypothetical protein BCR42DRAFT_488925 [Absidia repens]